MAQSGMIKGKITSKATQNGVSDVEVNLVELKLLKFTDGDGTFSFAQVPYGHYKISIGDGYNVSEVVIVNVDKEIVDLGDIAVKVENESLNATEMQLPSIGLEDVASVADDDGVSSQSYSSILTAYRDPFLSTAAYTFGPLRYRLRGYDRDETEVFVNNIAMNDVESGAAFWGQWGGLNDMFRNQNTSFALNPMEVGFGGLQGGTAIDASAANQRQQTRITYSASNRSYNNRLMVTHSTGMMKNGWAISASASKRWAKEGYIPGTFYDGYSYFLGVSKKINPKTMLHFTTFGSPTQRGKAMPAIQEAMDLAGDNYYNPNWGYLNGEKRNARVNSSYQPVGILSLEYNRSPLEQLNVALSYQDGFYGNSALDWYNAMDPRPDYYRKLPSYFYMEGTHSDSIAGDAMQAALSSNPDLLQIDWDGLYSANRLNNQTINGVTGNRSVYVIGQDRDDTRRISLATNYKKVLNENTKIFAGISYQLQMTESYRKMLDLLGGDYYVNLNQFAERTYVGNSTLNQNNILNPNEIIREGDKYNYNYKSTFHKGYVWGQGNFSFNKFDAFVTARVGMDAFQREGLYQSGLFSDDSYGKSDMQSFLTYAIKGGLTYKINGRNYLYLNAGYVANAPTFDNSYISPRVRNTTIDNIKLETSQTIEGGYLIHSPYLNGRLSGFVTDFNNITDIKRFYHEDYRTFVNFVMQNVGIRNLGAELALQAKLSASLTATGVATWTQVFYTTRPDISVYRDNDTNIEASHTTSYMKNYFVASGPQSAYSLGLNYRSPRYWYANVNFNYMDRNYMEVNPTRLTADAVDMMDRTSAEYQAVVNQEQFPSFYTVDIFAGKSFLLQNYFKKLPRSWMLYINVGVNNVTNNKDIITGGFNQLRFDYATRNPDKFPPKYFYGYGINYFVNIALKF